MLGLGFGLGFGLELGLGLGLGLVLLLHFQELLELKKLLELCERW